MEFLRKGTLAFYSHSARSDKELVLVLDQKMIDNNQWFWLYLLREKTVLKTYFRLDNAQRCYCSEQKIICDSMEQLFELSNRDSQKVCLSLG